MPFRKATHTQGSEVAQSHRKWDLGGQNAVIQTYMLRAGICVLQFDGHQLMQMLQAEHESCFP